MSDPSAPSAAPRRSSMATLLRRKPVPVFDEQPEPPRRNSIALLSTPLPACSVAGSEPSESISAQRMSHSTSASSSISSLPPAYLPRLSDSTSRPTRTTAQLPAYSSSTSPRIDLASDADSLNDLPTYSEIATTEPWCLPRTLFFFAIIPVLGVFFAALGAWVRWIDLDVGQLNEGDEEATGQRASGGLDRRLRGTEDRLREEVLKREKVVILRKAEIKWSTYCIYALVGQMVLIIGIAVLAVVLHFKKA